MKREDIEKLVGGYATATLTPQERRALFEAALADQGLYDVLVREQALKELLDDPGARDRLRDALVVAPPTIAERIRAGFRRPASWALAGGLAAAVVAMIVVRTPQAPVATPQLAMKLEAPPPPPPIEKPMARQEAAPQPSHRARALLKTQPEAMGAFSAADQVRMAAVEPQLVRCTVLRRGADAGYTEADASGAFTSGDFVRLAVEPSESGFLSVSELNAAGQREPLYQGAVVKGNRYVVPAQGAIELGQGPGEKRLFIALAKPPKMMAGSPMMAMRAVPSGEKKETEAPAAAEPAVRTVEIVLKYR
jgi:hypothetical protein